MLVNLSSDKVEIFVWNNKYLLEKNNLERLLPDKLNEVLKTYKPKNIYVLNWPWSFTTLRVWSLTLNIFNWLNNFSINFFDISKISFYKFFVKQKLLPNIGIIYIWQRKKARLYDFEKENIEYIQYDQIDQLKSDHFIDKIYQINSFKKVDFYLENENIVLKSNSSSFKIPLKNIPFKKTNLIKPNYMIKPNICVKKV